MTRKDQVESWPTAIRILPWQTSICSAQLDRRHRQQKGAC